MIDIQSTTIMHISQDWSLSHYNTIGSRLSHHLITLNLQSQCTEPIPLTYNKFHRTNEQSNNNNQSLQQTQQLVVTQLLSPGKSNTRRLSSPAPKQLVIPPTQQSTNNIAQLNNNTNVIDTNKPHNTKQQLLHPPTYHAQHVVSHNSHNKPLLIIYDPKQDYTYQSQYTYNDSYNVYHSQTYDGLYIPLQPRLPHKQRHAIEARLQREQNKGIQYYHSGTQLLIAEPDGVSNQYYRSLTLNEYKLYASVGLVGDKHQARLYELYNESQLRSTVQFYSYYIGTGRHQLHYRLQLGSIQFTHHQLMTDEDYNTHKLIGLVNEYKRRRHVNIQQYYTNKIHTLRNMYRQLTTQLSDTKQIDNKLSLSKQLLNILNQLKSIRLSQCNDEYDTIQLLNQIESTYALITQYRRSMNGAAAGTDMKYQGTAVRLTWKQIIIDSQVDNNRFNELVRTELDESEHTYVLTSMIQQLTLSNTCDDTVIQSKWISIKATIDQEIQLRYRTKCRTVGQPIRLPRLQYNTPVTSVELCPVHEKQRRHAIQSTNIYAVLYINGIIVKQSPPAKLQFPLFRVELSQIVDVELYHSMKHITLKLYQQRILLDEYIGDIILPIDATTNTTQTYNFSGHKISHSLCSELNEQFISGTLYGTVQCISNDRTVLDITDTAINNAAPAQSIDTARPNSVLNIGAMGNRESDTTANIINDINHEYNEYKLREHNQQQLNQSFTINDYSSELQLNLTRYASVHARKHILLKRNKQRQHRSHKQHIELYDQFIDHTYYADDMKSSTQVDYESSSQHKLYHYVHESPLPQYIHHSHTLLHWMTILFNPSLYVSTILTNPLTRVLQSTLAHIPGGQQQLYIHIISVNHLHIRDSYHQQHNTSLYVQCTLGNQQCSTYVSSNLHGTSVYYNQLMVLPISAAIGQPSVELTVYDSLNNNGSIKPQSHAKHGQSNLLASSHIPLTAILTGKSMKAQLPLIVNDSIMGYIKPTATASATPSIWLHCSTDSTVNTTHTVDQSRHLSFTCHLTQYQTKLQQFVIQTHIYSQSCQSRYYCTLVNDIYHHPQPITSYITPLQPPVGYERAELFTRLVSMIPIRDNTNVMASHEPDTWLTCKQGVITRSLSQVEHAILLCNYYNYIDSQGKTRDTNFTYVVLGHDYIYGDAAYVLRMIYGIHNDTHTGFIGSKVQHSNNQLIQLILIDPCTGRQYNLFDTQSYIDNTSVCSLYGIHTIFNQHNVHLNIQSTHHPYLLSYTFTTYSHWRTLHDTQFPLQSQINTKANSLQPPVIYQELYDVTYYNTRLRSIERCIETYIEQQRYIAVKQNTKYNYRCTQQLKQLLIYHEQFKQAHMTQDVLNQHCSSVRIQYPSIYGTAYCMSDPCNNTILSSDLSINKLLQYVESLELCSIDSTSVTYSVACYINPYKVYDYASIWCYIAVIR